MHGLFAYFSKKGKELCISYFKVYGLLAGLCIKEEEEETVWVILKILTYEENFGLIILQLNDHGACYLFSLDFLPSE